MQTSDTTNNGHDHNHGTGHHPATTPAHAHGPEAAQQAKPTEPNDGKVNLQKFVLGLIAAFDARVRREGDQGVLIDVRGDRAYERIRLTSRAIGIANIAYMAAAGGLEAKHFAALLPDDPANPEQVVNGLFGVISRRQFGGYVPEPAVWRMSDRHRAFAMRAFEALFAELVSVADADQLIRREGLAGMLVSVQPLSFMLATPEALCLEHAVAFADAIREVSHKDTRDFITAAKYLAGSLSGYDHASYKLILAELVALFRATERADEPAVNAPGPAAPATS